MYHLAVALLQFYILASGKVTFENLPNQVYLNWIVYETAFKSSLNGWSYVWYIESKENAFLVTASKHSGFQENQANRYVFADVRARCVSFPTDPPHRVEPIELLELDGNITAASGANAAPAFKNDTLLDPGAGVIPGAQAIYEEGLEVFAKTNMTKKRKL